MRHFIHMPYTPDLTTQQLGQQISRQLQYYHVVATERDIVIRYQPLVRARLHIYQHPERQETTVSYGTQMPWGMGWWSWLAGLLPGLIIWIIFMSQKGHFIDQLTSELQTALGSRHTQPSAYFPPAADRHRWYVGAAMWARWIGIVSFAFFIFYNFLIPLITIAANHHHSLTANIHFFYMTSMIQKIVQLLLPTAFGIAVILFSRKDKKGTLAGVLMLLQVLWSIVSFFISMALVHQMSPEEVRAASLGQISWWNALSFIVNSTFTISIGLLLWQSLRTGPGRYIMLAAFWTVGLGFTTLVIQGIGGASPWASTFRWWLSMSVGVIPAVLKLKAWYLMPKYMRLPKHDYSLARL